MRPLLRGRPDLGTPSVAAPSLVVGHHLPAAASVHVVVVLDDHVVAPRRDVVAVALAVEVAHVFDFRTPGRIVI